MRKEATLRSRPETTLAPSLRRARILPGGALMLRTSIRPTDDVRVRGVVGRGVELPLPFEPCERSAASGSPSSELSAWSVHRI